MTTDALTPITLAEVKAYVDYIGSDPDCPDLLPVRMAKQLLTSMEREERLSQALQYIVDHNWVAGATPIKWINEFVDVAKVALESGYGTGKEGYEYGQGMD